MLETFKQQFDAQYSKGQSFDQLMSGHNGASMAMQQIVLSFVDRSYRFNVASAFSKLDPDRRTVVGYRTPCGVSIVSQPSLNQNSSVFFIRLYLIAVSIWDTQTR
ncbi:MAG: hypothetical protein EBW86_04420 [Rhodobacteraceae bacterium]|nr:hypothetical protein [Paracoccaceae bacterium]